MAAAFPFSLSGIDHVAIRVSDADHSVAWYTKVLGLVKVHPEKWKPFPIFMMQAQFGVALFPADVEDAPLLQNSKHVKIDHFAFTVTNENFNRAKTHFDNINEPYDFQNHHYYHSIYLNDPDNHKVELTTLVGERIN